MLLAALLFCAGAQPGIAVDPSVEEITRDCASALAAFHQSLAALPDQNRMQRGVVTARAWDEDGEPLGEVRGEVTTYHAPRDRFRVDIRLEDEEGTSSYGTDGYRAWADDHELGVSVYDEARPAALTLERDLFGVPSFERLELDTRRLGSGDFADGAACPVHGATKSGVEVEGRLARGDSTLRLQGAFPTFFGRLEAEVRMSGFHRDSGAYRRTNVTSFEIVTMEQSLELQGEPDFDLDDSQLPDFRPAGAQGD